MNPWAIPALVALALQLWLNVYVFLRRPIRPLSMPLHGMLFAALLFTVGDLLGNFVLPGPGTKWIGSGLLYSGLIFLGPLWWLLALRFAEAQELGLRFTRAPWTYTPMALGIFLWLGLLTNPWFGQFLTLVPDGNSIRHWMWWVNATNNYAMLVAVFALYAILFARSASNEIRTRLVILMLATLSTGLASAIFVFSKFEMPFDPTSVGVGVSSLLFIVGIYRTRLFSLSPVAWSEVMKHQPGGVLVFSTEGVLLYANDNAIRMLAVEKLPASAQVLPALAANLHPAEGPLGSLSAAEVRQTLTGPLQRASGHLFRQGPRGERWLRIHSAPVPARSGTTKAWSLHLEDETLLQEAVIAIRENQVALIRAQKIESLGVLAGGIAHDFNNMLQGVLGNTDLALEEATEDSGLGGFLREIESSGVRASNLVQQLLLFSGQSRLAKGDVDIVDLLEQLQRSARTRLSESVRLHVQIVGAPSSIRADADQLRQALHSLVENASEALGDNRGTIEVRAETVRLGAEQARALPVYEPLSPGYYLRLQIHDSGQGIAEEIGDRIFEPFFSTKFAGRGLGLSAVLGVARGHGGSAGFESATGKGTTFSIYLPVTETPAQSPLPKRIDQEARATGGRVLVVDDELPVRSVCARTLRNHGLSVEEAGCGREALEVHQHQSFDLAIVDLTMPGIDGVETAQRLRNHDPSIGVILCSGFDDRQKEPWDRPDVADAFLHKPYRANELMDLVRGLIGSRPAETA